jgi:hypothetical protein
MPSRLLAVLLGSALASPAAAAPTFMADQVEDATLAQRAWAAGVACTGWTPPHHPEVRLVRGPVVDGYLGRAHVDAQGLFRIDLPEDRPRRTLIHEISHAWASRGPAALTEGRADLLADCIATRLPAHDLLDPDPGHDLDHLPDLRKWSHPRGAHTARLADRERSDAYLGASRLLRVVSTLVPYRELFPEDGTLRWKDLDRLLDEAGPRGAIVLDVLAGGPERQAAALTDRDRDGVPWLAEILGTTDPDRWDSDGDGWWDGAPAAPVGAVPLPPDGSAVCSGLTASPRGGRVQVSSRVTRASDPPRVRVIAGDVWILDDPARGVAVEPNQPILLALDGGLVGATGGAWALAGGQDLLNAWNCRSDPRRTIWLADPTFAPQLTSFVAQLDEHLDRANGLVGPAPSRLVVGLGTDAVFVDGDGVRLSNAMLTWARDRDRVDALAALAVALHRAWLAPPDERRWDTAEALLIALVDDPPTELFVSADRDQHERRAFAAQHCGWRGLIVGPCPNRPRASRADR